MNTESSYGPPPDAHRFPRDFAAEREWLRRLPPGPGTDLLMSQWENDPRVQAWFQTAECLTDERRSPQVPPPAE